LCLILESNREYTKGILCWLIKKDMCHVMEQGVHIIHFFFNLCILDIKF
jgi:hypothetical protein